MVIPTYGYEPVLEETIESLLREFNRNGSVDFEFVIVHTPVGDSTHQVMAVIRKFEPNARLITERRRGYGVAYVAGFNVTRGEIIVTMDADTTYPPNMVIPLVDLLIKRPCDFINTNRLNNFDPGAFRWTNSFGNRMLTLIMNFLFLTGFKDSQSGMWIIRKSHLGLMKCHGIHWAFSAEIKIEAKRRGLRCLEVPIAYRRRSGGVSTNGVLHGIRIALFMIAKRFGLAPYFPIHV